MTDPIVKQALLDLVDVMRRITKLVDNIDRRLHQVEEKQFVEVVRLNVKEGDVLFVDAETVDVEALMKWGFPSPKFRIVPVRVPRGKTVADCLAVTNLNNTNGPHIAI